MYYSSPLSIIMFVSLVIKYHRQLKKKLLLIESFEVFLYPSDEKM